MRALAILVACLIAAPASAFGHFGGPPPHFGGPPPHPGGAPHGHGGHGRGGLGYLDGALGPSYLPPLPGPDQAIAAPYVVPYAAASQCLPAAPARPHLPPHIIYIGHAPEIVGPKVIYGTN